MRKCIFCGKGANSAEDAWPLWLLSRFQPLSDNAFLEMELGKDKFIRRTEVNPKLRIKRVCRSCNNGWMSRLESKSKPLISAILDNQTTEIAYADQITLAQWSVKTAMVLATFRPEGLWFYSDLERTLMMQKKLIPQNTVVWLAKCVNHPNVYGSGHMLSGETTESTGNAYITTMAFGTLAIQVLTVKSTLVPIETIMVNNLREGPWDEIVVQVYPVYSESRVWPGTQGLNGDFGIDAFDKRFSPTTFT